MIMSMLFGDVVQCLILCSIDSSMILCIRMMMFCSHTMSGIDVYHAFVQVMLWLLCDGAFLYVDVSCCILTFVTMDDMMNVCLRLTSKQSRDEVRYISMVVSMSLLRHSSLLSFSMCAQRVAYRLCVHHAL